MQVALSSHFLVKLEHNTHILMQVFQLFQRGEAQFFIRAVTSREYVVPSEKTQLSWLNIPSYNLLGKSLTQMQSATLHMHDRTVKVQLPHQEQINHFFQAFTNTTG